MVSDKKIIEDIKYYLPYEMIETDDSIENIPDILEKTNLSGFYTKKGAGEVQLIALSKFLQANNFSFWDLGMGMIYKFELGALSIARKDFLGMVKKERAIENNLFTESRIKVSDIIFN